MEMEALVEELGKTGFSRRLTESEGSSHEALSTVVQSPATVALNLAGQTGDFKWRNTTSK